MTRALAVLSALALLVFGLALLGGYERYSPADWLEALQGRGDPLSRMILLEVRWPRVSAAMLTGALLGLAGALFQTLVRNPLADPALLGVSSGASLAVLVAVLLGGGLWATSSAALLGALLAAGLVVGLASGRHWQPERLLLTGMAVAAACGSLSSLLLTALPHAPLHAMLFWLLGDLGAARASWGPALLLILLIGLAMHHGPATDRLALGDPKAASLGVAVGPLRLLLLLLAVIASAVAVTLAGPIGFIGLAVPHLLRLSGLSAHRILFPAAALAGATLLTGADWAARTLAAPRELPVGALTALLGVPILLWLLRRHVR